MPWMGGNIYNHFYVLESGDFTVKNLTLKNGYSGYGGSITNRGTLTILNCTFQDNTGASSAAAGSGAIFNHRKNGGQPTAITETLNTSYVGNAGGLGGAILWNWQAPTGAIVTIACSTFSGNSGTYGGARSIIEEGHNLRAAVEATGRQVKHPCPASKLPVRGGFRVTCMDIGSAMTTNVRRIQRYLEAKIKLENEPMKVLKEQECSQKQPSVSFNNQVG